MKSFQTTGRRVDVYFHDFSFYYLILCAPNIQEISKYELKIHTKLLK